MDCEHEKHERLLGRMWVLAQRPAEPRPHGRMLSTNAMTVAHA